MEELDVMEALSAQSGAQKTVKREGRIILPGYADSRLFQIYSGLAVDVLEWAGQEAPGRPGKAMVVASPSAGDGRTLTAVNLAIAASGLGAKVMLIDADLVSPIIGDLLDIPIQEGLAEAVIEKRDPLELKATISGTDVDLLGAGKIAGINPFSIIAGKDFLQFLQKVRDAYDLVVIDTAPLCDNAYVLSLIKATREVLGVVRADGTKRLLVSQFIESVRNAEGELAGTVLNDFRTVIPRPVMRML